MKRFTYKVPEGKLIKIQVSVNENQIQDIVITGDFFLHPEECILRIEEKLRGCNTDEEKILETITEAIASMDAKLIGASVNDFTFAILQAIES
ncbi:MAG: lipoate protein ligase C-terminal domain-containing protein [Candidatus Thorarchaeota archaeon]